MRPARLLALPLIALALPAFAGPATQAGADRLAMLFTKYLGKADGAVRVVPDGESYGVTLDLSKAGAAGIGKGGGPALKMAPVRMELTELGGGKWHVVQDQPWSMALSVPGGVTSKIDVARLRFDGVFDAALTAFASGHAVIEGMASVQDQSLPDGGKVHSERLLAEQEMRLTGTAAAAGGVDATMRMTAGASRQSYDVTPKTGAPIHVAAALGPMRSQAVVKGLRSAGLYQLAGYFVSHGSLFSMALSQDQMKATIAGALPLFDSLSASVRLESVAADAKVGRIATGPLRIALDMNGLVKDGLLHERLDLEGISLPEGAVPGWAAKLVPERVGLDLTLKDFDLADPARMALAALDLSAKPPLPEAMKEDLLKALLPDGTVSIGTEGTGASNAIYTLSAKGAVRVGPEATPKGAITVTATGVEAVSQVLGGAPDGIRQKALFALLGAKGIAKQSPDGTLTWVIGSTPEGGMEINGMKMGIPH